jgi:hypothetical protein
VNRYPGECLGERSLFDEYETQRAAIRIRRYSTDIKDEQYTASHRCVAAVMTELLFMSREGFHTLLREIEADPTIEGGQLIKKMSELASKIKGEAESDQPMRQLGIHVDKRRHRWRRSSLSERSKGLRQSM